MDSINIPDKMEKMKVVIESCSQSIDAKNYTYASFLLGCMHGNCHRIKELFEQQKGLCNGSDD